MSLLGCCCRRPQSQVPSASGATVIQVIEPPEASKPKRRRKSGGGGGGCYYGKHGRAGDRRLPLPACLPGAGLEREGGNGGDDNGNAALQVGRWGTAKVGVIFKDGLPLKEPVSSCPKSWRERRQFTSTSPPARPHPRLSACSELSDRNCAFTTAASDTWYRAVEVLEALSDAAVPSFCCTALPWKLKLDR